MVSHTDTLSKIFKISPVFQRETKFQTSKADKLIFIWVLPAIGWQTFCLQIYNNLLGKNCQYNFGNFLKIILYYFADIFTDILLDFSVNVKTAAKFCFFAVGAAGLRFFAAAAFLRRRPLSQ